jgi:hypothetical protein
MEGMVAEQQQDRAQMPQVLELGLAQLGQE